MIHDNTRNITIDISPRQSGKTTRLIDTALLHCKRLEKNIAIVIVLNEDVKFSIRRMVEERLNLLIERGFINRHHFQEIFNNIKIYANRQISDIIYTWSIRNLEVNYNTLFLFDEYELMEDDIPTLYRNVYYASTPYRRFEESKIKKLLSGLEFDNSTIEDNHINAYMGIQYRNESEMSEDDCYLFRIGV